MAVPYPYLYNTDPNPDLMRVWWTWQDSGSLFNSMAVTLQLRAVP